MEVMEVPKAQQKKKYTYIGIDKGLEDGCTEGTKKLYGARTCIHAPTLINPMIVPVDRHAHKTGNSRPDLLLLDFRPSFIPCILPIITFWSY
jgi:hypothetical protein